MFIVGGGGRSKIWSFSHESLFLLFSFFSSSSHITCFFSPCFSCFLFLFPFFFFFLQSSTMLPLKNTHISGKSRIKHSSKHLLSVWKRTSTSSQLMVQLHVLLHVVLFLYGQCHILLSWLLFFLTFSSIGFLKFIQNILRRRTNWTRYVDTFIFYSCFVIYILLVLLFFFCIPFFFYPFLNLLCFSSPSMFSFLQYKY